MSSSTSNGRLRLRRRMLILEERSIGRIWVARMRGQRRAGRKRRQAAVLAGSDTVGHGACVSRGHGRAARWQRGR